jgi:dolichol-phosphate mannosyltransferase
MTLSPALTVVIPVFNEEAVVPALVERLNAALSSCGGEYRVVFVDDGSTDGTRALLKAAAERDPRAGVVFLSRNFGHQAAISAGLACVREGAAVVMDGDLQDPPELIPVLFAKIKDGHDVVYGVRRRRRGGLLKRALYWLFYRLLNLLSRRPIPLDAGDFCALSTRAVGILNAMPERDRFLRGMRAWMGFSHAPVDYSRDERFAGDPKYTLAGLFRLAFDGVFSSSDKPLKAASLLGLIVSLGSFGFGVYAVLWRLATGGGNLPGYASVATGIFFLGGVQLLFIGVLGEYISRIFNQVKGRPLYIVEGMVNLPPEAR